MFNIVYIALLLFFILSLFPNRSSEDVFRRLDKSEGIYRALDPKINPSQETQKLAFETYFREILEDMIDTNFDIYQKLSDDTEFGNLFRQVMFNNFQKDLSDRRDRNAG